MVEQLNKNKYSIIVLTIGLFLLTSCQKKDNYKYIEDNRVGIKELDFQKLRDFGFRPLSHRKDIYYFKVNDSLEIRYHLQNDSIKSKEVIMCTEKVVDLNRLSAFFSGANKIVLLDSHCFKKVYRRYSNSFQKYLDSFAPLP